MAASDHIQAGQFGGVRYYEGTVPPGQLKPRQAGRIDSKVTSLTGHMSQHGYAGLPPVETAYVNGETVIRDGHHRHDAAMATGTPMHIIGSTSRDLPEGTSEVTSAHYDEMWSRL